MNQTVRNTGHSAAHRRSDARRRLTSPKVSSSICISPPLCPVEALAIEAASILRAFYALQAPEERASAVARSMPDLRGFSDHQHEGTDSAIKDQLYGRLRDVEQFASSRRSQSKKGALFQLLLAANSGSVSTTSVEEVLPFTVSERLNEEAGKIDDLMSSALEVLYVGDDDDLQVLRSWFYPDIGRNALRGESLVAEIERLSKP